MGIWQKKTSEQLVSKASDTKVMAVYSFQTLVYSSNKPNSQKANINIFTAVRTSDLK